MSRDRRPVLAALADLDAGQADALVAAALDWLVRCTRDFADRWIAASSEGGQWSRVSSSAVPGGVLTRRGQLPQRWAPTSPTGPA